MTNNSKNSQIVDISELAFNRDKKNAGEELTQYFVQKNRQEKAWQITSAFKHSLRKNIFSKTEAHTLVEFLARKFDIRRAAVQYPQAGDSQTVRGANNNISPFKRKKSNDNDIFHQLFIRLQNAVQENLLDYNGARVLAKEVVTCYPTSKDRLR
ncbi:hypothetical protein [Desulforhopalus sp. IMCC35007]|uniref:hypothetical protein n=1 Tax=Desulforhopalus sp. IMCC35007 TaxID=2569543 RepID=UPI0010AE7157|nr:hypothetical protein [Desulforhopalus sp. IMCC35007]TKB12384.1 hypothetical protein FCL48_01670 [Desulforhopalus sp. IMCC35007]